MPVCKNRLHSSTLDHRHDHLFIYSFFFLSLSDTTGSHNGQGVQDQWNRRMDGSLVPEFGGVKHILSTLGNAHGDK